MNKPTPRIVTSDEEIDAAMARSKSEPALRVIKTLFDALNDKLVLEFAEGLELRIPRTLMQGLQNASPADVSNVEIEGPGTGLYWPALDVAHYVPHLMQGIFGTRKYMQELGRKGGSRTSGAKAAAARENGKKGGRKRKASV